MSIFILVDSVQPSYYQGSLVFRGPVMFLDRSLTDRYFVMPLEGAHAMHEKV